MLKLTPRLHTAAVLVALTAVYFCAGKFGLSLAVVNASVSAVWPPTGIALAVLLLWGYRLWPGIFLGALLVNLSTQGTLLTSLGIATGNTLEALLAAWLVNQLANGRHAFERALDIFKFILLAVIVSTTLSATFGANSLALGGFAPWKDYGRIWTTWWLGDAVGALIVTPLILIWATTPFPKRNHQRLLEAAVIAADVLLVSLIAFRSPVNDPLSRFVRFLLYPTALWAAYRFGQRGAINAVFTVACVALWETPRGHGPFVSDDPNVSLLLLQAYLGAFAVTNLILGALVAERERAEEVLQQAKDALDQANEELEQRVRERTGDLTRTYNALLAEVAARTQIETAHAQLAAIVESSSDAILSKTLQGVITSWNRGAQRMFGYAAEEIVGRSVAVLFPADHSDELALILENLEREEAVEPFETVRVRKDGRRVHVSLTLSPIKDETGRVSAVSAVMQDISERKRLEAEILQVSEHEQRRIAEDLHDGVGQQLGGISCLSEVLKKNLAEQGSPEAEAAAKISRLLTAAMAQTRSLARGLHPVAPETNGLMSALEDLAKRVSDLFQVACHFECPQPVLIEDNNLATHLYRIAQEAVTNAVKHGQARQIKIGLSSAPGKIILAVDDDGVGFKPGQRASKGLGMRIMNHRASMIGGDFSVQKKAGGGTAAVCTVRLNNESGGHK